MKGKAASVVWDGGVVGCGACHDLPPTGHPPLAGSVTPATCSQCHPSTVNGDGSINVNAGAHINGQADVSFSCTSCHGTAGRTGFQQGTDPDLASAPPVAPAGAPAYADGAHQPHLNPPVTGSIRGPLACNECHVVPSTPEHATNPPANKVVFGSLARTQGAVPVWTSTTTGCAATYCHGNFTFNGVSGSNATPLWDRCAAGLRLLPRHAAHRSSHLHRHRDPGHLRGLPSRHGQTPTARSTWPGCPPECRSDVVLDCTSCHGTAGRIGIQPGTDPLLAAAPPVAPTGAPAFAVGAHQNHLNPPATGSFRGPVACSECHLVPSSSEHAVNPPAQKVVFGALATTGGATPTWVSTTAGCAATYCHGNFTFNGVAGSNATPLWTAAGAHLHLLPRDAADRPSLDRRDGDGGHVQPVPPLVDQGRRHGRPDHGRPPERPPRRGLQLPPRATARPDASATWPEPTRSSPWRRRWSPAVRRPPPRAPTCATRTRPPRMRSGPRSSATSATWCRPTSRTPPTRRRARWSSGRSRGPMAIPRPGTARRWAAPPPTATVASTSTAFAAPSATRCGPTPTSSA